MRDPNRIVANWQKIAELHSQFPDWRMSQFLENVLAMFDSDPFYLEDDEFIVKFEEAVKKLKRTEEI